MTEESLTALFARLPRGYTEVMFEGRRWAATSTTSQDGRRSSLTAEQLGGEDGLGANLYVTATSELLRPCEVPADRVLAFLRDARAIEPRRDATTGYRTGWTLLRRRRGLLGLLDRWRWERRFR